MASVGNSIKVLEHCLVAPPSSAATSTHFSLPLTFFDLIWLRFHPVERIFFYSLHTPQSHPSFFFHKVVPSLKTSLSHTLQHFLPLAGNIVWPSDSHKPFIQFNPGDAVSLVLAQCDDDHDDDNNDSNNFNHLSDNSPREATESRTLVPHLESSDTSASIISLQITLFPNKGFCIGISTHHAVLDGKSSTMFIKAWAHVCKESSTSLEPKFEPLFERELIKDPADLESVFLNNWTQIVSKFDPSNTSNGRSLKIMSRPIEEHSVRGTYELTRADLERIKKRVLSKWELVEGEEPKPTTLSTFVISCAYVSVCIAKAFEAAQNFKKFALGFNVDCRARLEPPIPENYFGNCVAAHMVETQPEDFVKEDGVIIVAKKIWNKIKKLDKGKGALDGVETVFARFMSMLSGGIKGIGVAGSNRFGVYDTDFGWGKPAKVEITSIDRGLNIGLAESKDGTSGVEVGLVMNKHVMDLFYEVFNAGLDM